MLGISFDLDRTGALRSGHDDRTSKPQGIDKTFGRDAARFTVADPADEDLHVLLTGNLAVSIRLTSKDTGGYDLLRHLASNRLKMGGNAYRCSVS